MLVSDTLRHIIPRPCLEIFPMQALDISTSIALEHVETDVERRVQIAFSVDPGKVQSFLPPSWKAASRPPTGPIS
jgi:hypothetical protein